MRVEHQHVGTVDVYTPHGALVDEDGHDFCEKLVEAVRASNPRVIVAMQEVPYVDSAALEKMLEAADELSERALALKLVNVTQTCREIFEVTGLSRRFRFFQDVQDGVRSFL